MFDTPLFSPSHCQPVGCLPRLSLVPAPWKGDGYAGYPEWAPYDVIHVGAAAPSLPPALLEQLAPGGRLVSPVGPAGGPQELVVVDKDEEGRLTARVEMGVM